MLICKILEILELQYCQNRFFTIVSYQADTKHTRQNIQGRGDARLPLGISYNLELKMVAIF